MLDILDELIRDPAAQKQDRQRYIMAQVTMDIYSVELTSSRQVQVPGFT